MYCSNSAAEGYGGLNVYARYPIQSKVLLDAQTSGPPPERQKMTEGIVAGLRNLVKPISKGFDSSRQ